MRTLLSCFSLSTLLILASCSRDNDVSLSNQLTFDGQSYTPTHGFFVDLGTVGETHYSYDVFIADGEIGLDDEGLLDVSEDVNIVVFARLGSEGPNHFNTGEFEYSSSFVLPPKNIFILPQVSLRNPAGGFSYVDGSGGSISIARGAGSIHIFNFDATFRGRVLTGSFTGGFDVLTQP